MRLEQLLKRLRREFIKVNILQAALDSLIFFLAANLVIFFFSVQVLTGLSNLYILVSVTFLVFILDLGYRYRTYDLELYEKKNPELREKLRTARDNVDSQNIVSQALFDDVIDNARKITSESIIPSKQIINKIIVVGTLSFLTVFSGLADIQLEDRGIELIESQEFQDLISDEEDDEFELRNASDIYGEAEEIDLEHINTDFNITGEGTEEAEDFGFEQEENEFNPEIAERQLADDLNLAKEYILQIRR